MITLITDVVEARDWLDEPDWYGKMGLSKDEFTNRANGMLFIDAYGVKSLCKVLPDGRLEWHGFVIPERRKDAVHHCTALFKEFQKMGLTCIVAPVPLVATSRFITKRLGFTATEETIGGSPCYIKHLER